MHPPVLSVAGTLYLDDGLQRRRVNCTQSPLSLTSCGGKEQRVLEKWIRSQQEEQQRGIEICQNFHTVQNKVRRITNTPSL